MPDVIWRLLSITWQGVPVASLAVFVIGGLMYAAMSMSTRSTSSSTSVAVRRPGWIARRRARGGIRHPSGRVGVGYASATRTVHLSVKELSGQGAVFGGPGSGKTNFLQLLVEASAGIRPVVIVDPKGSPALEATVRAHGGQVWTIDGKLPADLLDPRPHQVPDLLLEAEDYSPDARVFRDAAHQRALWAAWALALRGEPMDLARLRRLLDREALLKALDPYRRDPRVAEWVQRLEHHRGGVEDSGAMGLDRALGILLDGPAMLGSLRSCPEALPVPPDCPAELLERMGADILAKVDRRWPRRRHELGPCLVWREGLPTSADGCYGRMYDPAIGKTDYVHRIVWRRCFGPIPQGKDVDHKCNVTLCERPDHLQPLTKPENTRRRHQRAETTDRTTEAPTAVQRFAVALFAGIDRTTVDARALSLADLVALLSRFEVLEDKRRGRCWSPTEYAPGHTARGNAGVAAVSCLVFDLDRVPPDPNRLEVCWIGHTTWSHTTIAPRWRITIPLAEPVPVSQWRDVWLRARAALCPEADPSCKDPSRQYYVPAHAPGAVHQATHHPGAMLDVASLPELPSESRAGELRRSPSAKAQRMSTGADRRRGEAYMSSVIDGLEATAPGGRNDALNRAAWTLGRWVAAGALEQADVEDQLYAAAARNGLVSDDGQRQTWATIRSGLAAGLLEPRNLDER